MGAKPSARRVGPPFNLQSANLHGRLATVPLATLSISQQPNHAP
jgi:hypothetical protein